MSNKLSSTQIMSGGFSNTIGALENNSVAALTNNCKESCGPSNNCNGGNCAVSTDDTNKVCTPPVNNCGQGTNCWSRGCGFATS